MEERLRLFIRSLLMRAFDTETQPDAVEGDPETAAELERAFAELEAAGATVHTGTLPLRAVGSAIRKKTGGS